MNGIDLANFFFCIPGAKVVEEPRQFLSSFVFERIQKCYQQDADVRSCHLARAKIEKGGKLFEVTSLFSNCSNRSWYLRRCKDDFGDKKGKYNHVTQWCFNFQKAGDPSQFSLSFIWDYSYIKGYSRMNGMREAFIEGVVIAVCDYKVWKTEKFRLYANDDYAVDDGAVLLNDVRSVLKDKLLIQLYDRYMPTAELKPRKLVDFNRKYHIFWWKNFFRRLFLWCGGWIFCLLRYLACWILAKAEDLLGWIQEARKKAKRDIESQKGWIE